MYYFYLCFRVKNYSALFKWFLHANTDTNVVYIVCSNVVCVYSVVLHVCR